MPSPDRILIKNGRVIDPSVRMDRRANLLLENGRICALDPGEVEDAQVVDAEGLIVAPGLVDLHAELREPGFEEDETIETGLRAAVAGGFTTVACVPNTDPPIDTPAGVQFVQHKTSRRQLAKTHIIACISKGRRGEELAEIGGLAETGAVAFSDADRPVQNSALFRRALQYCRMFDKPVMNAPEVAELSNGGVMHEGTLSMILGLKGIPAAAEDVMTGRDLRLAEATGGQLHLSQISSSGSVGLIRRFKARGIAVTASMSAVNFAISDDPLKSFESRFKVRPPLRPQPHVDACVDGLIDGTIDVISAGHTPRASEKKMLELDQAPFGMTGFETCLSLAATYLVRTGKLDWIDLIDRLSTRPAQILGIEGGSLQVGSAADVVLINPQKEWNVSTDLLYSKATSTPLADMRLYSQVQMTFVDGVITHQCHETAN